MGMDCGAIDDDFQIKNLEKFSKYWGIVSIENDTPKDFNMVTLNYTAQNFTINLRCINLSTYEKAFEKTGFINLTQKHMKIPDNADDSFKEYYADMTSISFVRFFTAEAL